MVRDTGMQPDSVTVREFGKRLIFAHCPLQSPGPNARAAVQRAPLRYLYNDEVSRLLLVLCGGFALGAIVCAIQYFLIRAGRFRRNPYLGLPGYSRESDKVWARAHEAAAPWIGRAGVVAAVAATFAGLGLAIGAGLEGWDPLTVVSAAIGAVAAGLYVFGANNAGHEATKRMRRHR